MSTDLKSRIIRHIQTSGPLPLAEYMHWCMADAKAGYYTNQQAIGARGDFVTAPEISQMFGELIGIWAIEAWQACGSPEQFNLVELGPGKGTLMSDLLRATAVLPAFQSAAQINMIETSERLQAIQREVLGEANVSWHKSVKSIADQPSIIIANEFLDVLPIRQYVKTDSNWHERVISIDGDNELIWSLSNAKLEAENLPEGAESEPDGAILEISATREAFLISCCEHILKHGGAALFIDYGHGKTGFGETFQAMRNHGFADPLEAPGEVDLTSHVDFGALANIVKEAGLEVKPLMTQGDFLIKLGLLERAGQLGHGKSEEMQAQITSAVERLAGPQEMGTLFKVFCVSAKDMKLPPFD